MATIPNGIYRFTNQYFSSRALNVIGTNAASTGRNVCLYEDTLSDPMQKWSLQRYATATIDGSIYPTYRLHSIVNNAFVLDRSDGSIRTSYNNNAHLCKTTATSANDSELIFKELSDNTYLIRLRYYDLYLTATTDPGNSPSSAISTSEALSGGEGGKGNVYWAPLHYKDSKQRWFMHNPNTPDPDPDPPAPDPGPDGSVIINGTQVPLAEWPVGSFWTVDGTGTGASLEYNNSWECCGFSRYVYAQIWGSDTYGTPVTERSSLNGSEADFNGISVGARLNCDRYPSEKAPPESNLNHSFVIIGKDSNGITVYDANWTEFPEQQHCIVGKRFWSYQQFANKFQNIKSKSYTP